MLASWSEGATVCVTSLYQESFAVNAVSGRRLVWVTSTTLPRMGITDWNHIQVSGNCNETAAKTDSPIIAPAKVAESQKNITGHSHTLMTNLY